MVLTSGIPELRQFCHKITAGAQLLEAKHFLQSTLPSLLSSVEIWASSSPSRAQVQDRGQQKSIHDLLEELKQEVRVGSHPSVYWANLIKVFGKINQSRIDFNDTFREVLSTYLGELNPLDANLQERFADYMKERRNDFWEDAAEIRGREWFDVGKSYLNQNVLKSNSTQWHWCKYARNHTSSRCHC